MMTCIFSTPEQEKKTRRCFLELGPSLWSNAYVSENQFRCARDGFIRLTENENYSERECRTRSTLNGVRIYENPL